MPASYIKVLALFLLLALFPLLAVPHSGYDVYDEQQSATHSVKLTHSPSLARIYTSHRVRSETIERSTCSVKVYYTWCICFETIYLSHVEQLYVSSTHNSIMIPLATVLTLSHASTHTHAVFKITKQKTSYDAGFVVFRLNLLPIPFIVFRMILCMLQPNEDEMKQNKQSAFSVKM